MHYPELYVLEGGYSRYFKEAGSRCQPQAYITMDDPRFAAARREDISQFRRGQFGRTKSYAFGDNSMFPATNAQKAMGQPKRNTAPGGLSAMSSLQGAPAPRRISLHTLAEGSSSPVRRNEDDEDTDREADIAETPCPPPAKGGMLNVKKLSKAALTRAETYGPSRMASGY